MSRLEQLEKMLVAEPRDVFLNFALAMEYFKAGRHDEALTQFGRVNEIDPDYVAAYFHKANSLVALGRKAEAKPLLEHGIEVAKRTKNPHAASEMSDLLKLLE
jgi:tetratricopeptide (TPR) repeat protein